MNTDGRGFFCFFFLGHKTQFHPLESRGVSPLALPGRGEGG